MDVREKILTSSKERKVVALLTACGPGMLAGVGKAVEKAVEIGLEVRWRRPDGTLVKTGDIILVAGGSPWQVVMAEDQLIGLVSKSSGVATAAYQARRLAGEDLTVVSGAWKKMPPEVRIRLREAVVTAGIKPRITDPPFIYLDKNIIRCLGGISETLAAFSEIRDQTKVIQVRGETGEIGREALDAVYGGADIIMIDTGNTGDIDSVSRSLQAGNCREKVKIAFAGGVNGETLEKLKECDVDIVDIGTGIVDAPLLDLKLDVVPG